MGTTNKRKTALSKLAILIQAMEGLVDGVACGPDMLVESTALDEIAVAPPEELARLRESIMGTLANVHKSLQDAIRSREIDIGQSVLADILNEISDKVGDTHILITIGKASIVDDIRKQREGDRGEQLHDLTGIVETAESLADEVKAIVRLVQER